MTTNTKLTSYKNIFQLFFYQATLILSTNILILCFSCQQETNINWMEFETVDNIFKKKPKKGLVFIYDPSCEDCLHAKEYVQKDPFIISYINQHYYPMQLGVFEERTIHFNGKDWHSERSFQGPKYSTLAKALCQESDAVHTPTYAFLDEQMNLIIPIKKNLSREELKLLLTYVKEDKFKEMNIEEYKAILSR